MRKHEARKPIKFPKLGKFLTSKIFAGCFLTCALLLVGSIVLSGVKTFNELTEEPEYISPYLDIQPMSSPATTWANDLINETPPLTDSWNVSNITKGQQVFDQAFCVSQPPIPTSLMNTYIANSNNFELRIQVYGAGQGARNFNRNVTELNNCTYVETAHNDLGGVAKFNNGFLIVAGDALIGLTTNDNNVRDQLLEHYIARTAATLRISECLALNYPDNDADRSFFYNQDAYTGLNHEIQVETQLNIFGLPTVKNIDLREIKNTNATEPEAPLPGGFPTIPNEISRPGLPEPVPFRTEFVGTAVFPIVDEEGPGCGWEWAGQKQPTYNTETLESDKTLAIQRTQTAIDNEAQQYIDSWRTWSWNMLIAQPQIDNWNRHVAAIDRVHERWDWLETERDKIETPWYNYVQAHDRWASFDTLQDEAASSYRQELEQCRAAQEELEEWEDRWGSLWRTLYPDGREMDSSNREEEDEDEDSDNNDSENSPNTSTTPSTTPTPAPDENIIPPQPAGCWDIPTRPSILDQSRPTEPSPPNIPANVTIPNSWPRPQN